MYLNSFVEVHNFISLSGCVIQLSLRLISLSGFLHPSPIQSPWYFMPLLVSVPSRVSKLIHHDYDHLPDIVLAPILVPKQPWANEIDSWRPLKLTQRWQQQFPEILYVARWGLHGLDFSIHCIHISIEFGGQVNTSSSLCCSDVPEPFLLGSRVHYPAAIGHSYRWILFTSKGHFSGRTSINSFSCSSSSFGSHHQG